MAKAIFIAENMASTKLGSLLRSAKQDTPIENGCIVTLGDLVAGESDLYEAGAVTANTDDVYLVDGVELDSDEQLTKGLDDFENPANKPFRVRKALAGDRFSISASAITGTPVVGEFVEVPATGNNLAAVQTPTAGASLVCEVVALWTFGTRAIPMVRLVVK